MTDAGYKRCHTCDEEKPVTEFFRLRSNRPDLLNSYCKECQRIRVRTWREANRERVRAQTRARHAADPERHRARDRAWREANPEKMKATSARVYQAKKRAGKAQAQAAVAYAIRSGRLVRQPCKVCGSQKAEAHHPDYSRPLDVVWLCSSHHKQLHLGRTVIVRPKVIPFGRRRNRTARPGLTARSLALGAPGAGDDLV